jgi:hypothetical protein
MAKPRLTLVALGPALFSQSLKSIYPQMRVTRSATPAQKLALNAAARAKPEIAPLQSLPSAKSRSYSSSIQETGNPISREPVNPLRESWMAVLARIPSVLAWGESCKTL